MVEEFGVVVDQIVDGVEGGADRGEFEDVAGPALDDVPSGLVGGVVGQGVADDMFEVLDVGAVVEFVGESVGLAQDGAEFVLGVVEGFAVGGWGAVAGGGDDGGVEGGVGGLELVAGFDGAPFQVGDGRPLGDVEGAGVAGEGVGQAGEGLPAAFQVEGQGLEVLGEHLGCFALPAVPPGQLAQLRRLVGHPLPEDAGIVLQVRDHLGVPRQGVEAQTRKLPVRH